MIRLLLLFAVAPLLLAPVRLDNATPGFAQSLGGASPAPEAYSLPPAAPLVTPTVIYVSPTVYQEVSLSTVSGSLGLPPQPQAQPQPPVIIQKIYMAPDTTMPFKRAALCQRAMLLVQDMAMLSYSQKESRSLFALATAAAAGVGQATAQKWPNMRPFAEAADNLPWFYPNKAELTQAVSAATSLCTRR